jgi:formamidase
MSGLGGLNKSPGGMVVGVCQFQLPVVETPSQLRMTAERICDVVRSTKAGMPTLDLIVFPEYSLHGLSMNVDERLMCTLDGPEVASFQAVCKETATWGCFSLMERNPGGYPWNAGSVVDATGDIVLYYRKLHPWVPVEPWQPGDLGIPVCDGPAGARIALIICHDGMFPEMARECAYKGAEIVLRTAGYTAPIRNAWRITNQANAFCNLAVTASVCLCGSDGTFDSMGEGMIVNFDGVPMAEGGGRPDEIITAEVRPDLVREARRHWSVENNIYQLAHRGYVAVKGGAADCPYTFMQDLVAGRYRLPWEAEVVHTDGTSCGFPAPTRHHRARPPAISMALASEPTRRAG